MALDSIGFLWISTEKGLDRFDGSSFKNYLGSPFRMGYDRMSTIYGKNDTLFFLKRPHMFAYNGKLIYDTTQTFMKGFEKGHHEQFFRKPDQVPEGPNGFDPKEDFYFLNDSSFYSHSIRWDPNYYYYEKGENKGSHKYLNNVVNRLLNHIFVLDGKLCALQKGILRVFDGNQIGDSLDLTSLGDNLGVCWRYGEAGVYINDVNKGDIYRLDGLSPEVCLKRIVRGSGVSLINSIMERSIDGSIWIGSRHEGLYYLRKKDIQNWSSVEYPENNSMVSVYPVGRDSVLTERHVILTPDRSYMLDIENKAEVKKVLSKTLWWQHIGDTAILMIETDLGPRPTNTTNGLFNSVVDNSGTNWASIGGAVYRYGDDHWEQVPIDGWNSKEYVADALFYNGTRNELWVNIKEEGIWSYNIDNGEFGRIEGIPKAEVLFVHFDRSGLEFVRVSDQGFYLRKGGKALRMPPDPLNYLQYAHCIVEDNQGFFWISSDNGLFKVLRQDLLDYFQNPDKKIYYDYYDKSRGFLNNEFNGSGFPCGATISNGKIAFPSFEGVVVFDPEKVVPTGQNIPILDGISIDGVDTALQNTLLLDQNYREIEIGLAHSFYGHPNNRYMAYQIEGYHKEWQRVPDDYIIHIQKLEYGDYTLRVKKLMGHGRDNYMNLTLPIKVSKMYYETSWFRAGTIILMLIIIIGIINLRSARAKRKQLELEAIIEEKTGQYKTLNTELRLSLSRLRASEREQKITMKFKDRMMAIYTHDIRGPLRFISSMAHDSVVALGKLKQEDIKRYFGMIEDASQKVFLQTERMFNISNLDDKNISIRPEPIDLHKAIEQCLSTFLAQARKKKIKLINDTPEGFIIQAEINVLDIILNNVIQNALKYTSEGSIRLVSSHLKDYSVLSITDTGVGMAEERLEQLNEGEYWSKMGTDGERGTGFGLKVVKDFLRKLEGHMEIESEPGKGTVVNIFFKKAVSS